MTNRIRNGMAKRDQGFTLIELLVVIIIIGILAAIAIPVFLNQRKKGVDAGLKSDLKNAATQVETWVTDNPQADVLPGSSVDGADATAGSSLVGFKSSPGNTVTLAATSPKGTYCITASNPNASKSTAMSYDSDQGGVVANWGACS